MIVDDRMFRARNLSPAVLRDARFRRGRLRDPGYRHPPKRTTSIGIVGARGHDDRRRRSPRHFLRGAFCFGGLRLRGGLASRTLNFGGGGGASETAASFIAGLAGST